MKWKNHYPDNHVFFITSTVNGQIALFKNPEIARVLLDNLVISKGKYEFKLLGYVIMPEHWHFLLYFGKGKDCLSFIRDYKRFTSLKISTYLKNNKMGLLDKFALSPKSKVKYAIWKEQAGVLPLDDLEKIKEKLDYIHNNPVKRGLVNHPNDYLFSSAAFYYNGNYTGPAIDAWDFSCGNHSSRSTTGW
jgi:putative transposase